MSIGTVLKRVRMELGLSQNEFADFLGVFKYQISMYENDNIKPYPKTVRKIVNRLKNKGIKIEYKDLME